MNQKWQQDQIRRQQEMMRKQQEQMRQQQEQMRKQQMQAAWMQQQKAKEAQGQQSAEAIKENAQDASSQTVNEILQAVSYYRQEYKAKRITRAQVEELMLKQIIKDPAGTLWTVGFETGKWYYRSGDRWIKGEPTFAPKAAAAVKTKKHPGKAIGAFIRWFILTLIFAYGAAVAASLIAEETGNYDAVNSYATFAAVLVGFIGLGVTISKTKKAYSGK